MNRKELVANIKEKKTCLCVGLDSDIEKLPGHLPRNAASVFRFNKEIIDATRDLCVAYKVNTAFYESLGPEGWDVLNRTADYISDGHFRIADAKRGDIGNTSLQYAKAFFRSMDFDAVTIAPYMGRDSIEPFLSYKDKWAVILALTSNPGSSEFQKLKTGDRFLWEEVLEKTSAYGNNGNTMFVIGATRADDLNRVRKVIPDHFLLVPGVGAQGGSLDDVILNGKNADTGLLINVSRGIIFAGSGSDFAEKARDAAMHYHDRMKAYL